MKSPASSLQAVAGGHQKMLTEPLFLQGGGGGGGTRVFGLSFLCENGAKYASVRCTMEYTLRKSRNKGFQINNNNAILLSKLCATSTQPSSAYISPEEEEEEEEEEEDPDDDLSYFRGLVLDLYYRPINIVCWRRAICMEFLEKADVLEYYDQTVTSPGGCYNIPAVLRLVSFVHIPKRTHVKVQLSRKNIYGRDLFTCQYCGSKNDLTIDHILPVSRGGKWSWENLVTACSECNSKKSYQTLEEAGMKLMRVPKAPKDYHLSRVPLAHATYKMLINRERIPNEWIGYVSTKLPGT